MAERERDPDDLGGLWFKTGTRGDYMTGTIAGQKVVCFFNEKATEENRQPTWRVKRSRPREDREQD